MNQQQYTTLLEVLKHLPDPRKRKRRRHRFLTLLCLIVAAVASTLRTPPAIARWVHSQREELFAVLPPAVAHLPSDATLRRARSRLDVAVLEQALTAFQPPTSRSVQARAAPPDTLQGGAIDGKAIGGGARERHACQLVSLVQHTDARVLGQVAVALKREQRSAVPGLLAGPDLSGKLVRLDALHSVRATARQIRLQNGH